MAISEKIKGSISKSSWIRKMFEEGNTRKAKYGAENVFDFSLGNPNLEPPEKFRQTLLDIINDPSPGKHAYMPNAGYQETRQAVADYLNKTNRGPFRFEDIVMTVGAGGGLNVVFKTILDPGDEVVVFKPYFVEYDFYLNNHQGIPKIVATKPDFSMDMDLLSESLNERTKAVLVNSPNNPTGKVYNEDQINELASVLRSFSLRTGRTIYLISDEPYRKIIYDAKVPSIFDAYDHSVVVTSFSKDLSLPGERIGYIAVNPELKEKNAFLAGLIFSNRILGFVNAPALMQRVVPHLLDESVDIDKYRKKRDLLCNNLKSFGYDFHVPEGTFYLFPKSPLEDDVAFVSALQEENILTVPGIGFGGEGHFRISYCVEDKVIEKSLPGFERVIRRIHGQNL